MEPTHIVLSPKILYILPTPAGTENSTYKKKWWPIKYYLPKETNPRARK